MVYIYIPQRTLPDKAIDLIDMTAAHLASKNSQTDVETLDQRLKKLEAAKEAAIKAVKRSTDCATSSIVAVIFSF